MAAAPAHTVNMLRTRPASLRARSIYILPLLVSQLSVLTHIPCHSIVLPLFAFSIRLAYLPTKFVTHTHTYTHTHIHTQGSISDGNHHLPETGAQLHLRSPGTLPPFPLPLCTCLFIYVQSNVLCIEVFCLGITPLCVWE